VAYSFFLQHTLDPQVIALDMQRASEPEMDETWNFVGKEGNPHWLWHAIDHHTGAILASYQTIHKELVVCI